MKAINPNIPNSTGTSSSTIAIPAQAVNVTTVTTIINIDDSIDVLHLPLISIRFFCHPYICIF